MTSLIADALVTMNLKATISFTQTDYGDLKSNFYTDICNSDEIVFTDICNSYVIIMNM